MIKLTSKEEKELTYFIKDWLKVHGYSQKDLAERLNISSSRTSEIMKRMKEIYKRGGFFNIAKKLIEIEQFWINNNIFIRKNIDENQLNNEKNMPPKKASGSYDQLDINYNVDIDLLMDRMEKDFKE